MYSNLWVYIHGQVVVKQMIFEISFKKYLKGHIGKNAKSRKTFEKERKDSVDVKAHCS